MNQPDASEHGDRNGDGTAAHLAEYVAVASPDVLDEMVRPPIDPREDPTGTTISLDAALI